MSRAGRARKRLRRGARKALVKVVFMKLIYNLYVYVFLND